MAQRKVGLECSQCGARNYSVTVNANRQHRLELKKFCKHCGQYTIHRETK